MKQKKESVKAAKQAVTSKNAKPEKAQAFIYLGPTVRGTRLINNQIFSSDIDAIKTYLKAEIEAEKAVLQLIVPVEDIAIVRERITRPGQPANIFYERVSALKLNKEEK